MGAQNSPSYIPAVTSRHDWANPATLKRLSLADFFMSRSISWLVNFGFVVSPSEVAMNNSVSNDLSER